MAPEPHAPMRGRAAPATGVLAAGERATGGFTGITAELAAYNLRCYAPKP
jgi:hypothetical protein